MGRTPTDTYQNLDYQQFDGKGNIITIADNLNAITHGYTYDTLDRLLTAQGTGTNPYSQSYQYDRIGNITYKSDVGDYIYYYNDRPHAVRFAGNISLQYDPNGNMTQRAVSGGITLDTTYNYDNKPNLIKRNGSNYVEFTYDGNGQRVKKYNYSTGQSVIYFGELYETRSGAGTLHLFAGNQRVASVLSDGRTQFYHPNHLGSASVITDQNGNRKERMEYFPFGTYREAIDYDSNFPDVFYTFTGQEDDDDLGLYNYNARLYDPVLGRFISPDRLIPDPSDPQSLNRYTYCLNNPLIYTDPSGEIWQLFLFAFLFGAFSGAVQAHMNNQNWFVGALVGGAIGLVSAGVGVGIGGAVTTWLTPTAMQVGTHSAANIVGAMAGGFTGGAVSGGLNAAAYGGNVWQAALYGGLIGAAIAGTIAGAIELNNWYGSTSEFGGPSTGGNRLTESYPTASYENPIEDGSLRIKDNWGSGVYGASRGKTTHGAIDILGEVGDPVGSPFAGRARVDSYKEAGGGVNVTGKTHYARLLHIQPGQDVINAGAKGLQVFRGQVIGTIADIRGIFPGIQNHVHFELYTLHPFRNINPTCYVLDCFR